ncbi:MAG: pantoate--beta-alanine ligase [Nitrospirota bacterium]
MKHIKTVGEMAKVAGELKCSGLTIGFVPTMGYLHEGHLSLIRRAKKECDYALVSIFVNPSQFGPQEDFSNYPRDMEGDLAKCRHEDVKVVFTPEAGDIYPDGFSTSIEVGKVSEGLCGALRPGHFRGVATVVTKLFNIIRPDKAYFGQKDFQQTLVVKKLAADLNLQTEIVVAPTVREPDGLAMSSRNAYLTQQERAAAAKIYRSLASARSLRESGERRPDVLEQKVRGSLTEEPLIKVEYVSVVDPEGDKILRNVRDGAVIAAAVRIGRTRLIDNIVI